MARMSESVLDKAQQLAEVISSCDELEVLRRAAEQIDADDKASAMLKEFQAKQATAEQAHASGIELPREQIVEIQAMQAQIHEYQCIQDFAKAQGNFNDLMNRVNDIIAAAVMGAPDEEQPEPQDHGGHVHGPGCSH